MTIVISGLLSGVLLSATIAGPSNINPYTYCITYDLQTQKKNACEALVDSYENLQLKEIDELIGAINDQHRSLKNLLKEKSKVLDRIQTVLDFCAYTQTPFTESQISSFTRFISLYNMEAGALQATLRKINSEKELFAAKKELLHKEADFNSIIEELASFSDSMSEAISYLRGIVELGNSTLKIL